MGSMEAVRHCLGTYEVVRELLKRTVRGSVKNGAPSRRYHAGRPSSPVAVGRRQSSAVKTCQTLSGGARFCDTVCLRSGHSYALSVDTDA